jgi:hypothetical protein
MPDTPPPQRKRQLSGSFTPELSDDEEQRIHATFLLNLASPEAVSRTPSEESNRPRKKAKSRYANTMTQPFSQIVRPAYEFMTEPTAFGELRYTSEGYTAPHSPPQSPPENAPRMRARPYAL